MRRAAVVLAAWLWLAGAGPAATVYEIYRVQPGDTLESIAGRYHVSAATLRELNKPLNTAELMANDLLTVPVSATAPALGGGGDEAGANGANGVGGIRGTARAPGPDGQPEAVPDATAPLAGESGGRAVTGAGQPGGNGRVEFNVNGAVGRLGTIVSESCGIRRERREDATLLFRATRGAKLVVTTRLEDWFGVMMVDRTTGWLPVNAVELSTTELVAGQASPEAQRTLARGEAICQTALRYLGVPYVWGGESFNGIDCSGLVLQAYRSQGIHLPRVSREQFQVGTSVRWNELQPGDRLHFASNGRYVDHVGLYLGNGQFVHASGRRRAVAIDNLFNPSYWNIFVGAKR